MEEFENNEHILRDVLYNRIRRETARARSVCLKSARELCGLVQKAPAVHVISCVSHFLLNRTLSVEVEKPCTKFLQRYLSAHLQGISEVKTASAWMKKMVHTDHKLEARDKFSDDGELLQASKKDSRAIFRQRDEEEQVRAAETDETKDRAFGDTETVDSLMYVKITLSTVTN